jgi:hypothetical protein
MEFTTDFPAWTLVSWVLIFGLYWILIRRAKRLDALEKTVYGKSAPSDDWQYQNYHRAASEAVLSALLYPSERFKHLAEAQEYVARAMVTASTDEQRKFTQKLVEAVDQQRNE